MKWLCRHWNRYPYTEYLRQYYRRDVNPYYETIEDKWAILRPLMIEMAELQPGERVLDLGTGLGFQAAAFASCEYPSVGIDYVLDRVKLAKERLGTTQLHWAAADAAQLPFARNAFDVVTLSLALHDMPIGAIQGALGEAQRVARRRVVIAEPRLPDYWLYKQAYRAAVALFDESIFITDFLEMDIELLFQQAALRLIGRQCCAYGTLAVYACDSSE